MVRKMPALRMSRLNEIYHAGVGRMVALKFAEAGYTVFGCLPHGMIDGL